MDVTKLLTRQVFDCPIFGTPKDLPTNKLPTGEEIIRCCSKERYNLALQINNKSVSFKQVTSTVTNKVISLYEKASIPTVTDKRIAQLITALHDKYYSLRKSYTRDKNKTTFKKKVDEFKQKCSLLFDVAACKCLIVVECTCKKTPDLCRCKITIDCSCKKSKKIPPIELRFVYSLRVHGKGKIGAVDLRETKKCNKSLERKLRDSHLYVEDVSKPSCSHSVLNLVETEDDECCVPSTDNDSDQDYTDPLTCISSKPIWQMRVQLQSTAIISNRYGVSDRATAAIASSVLHDFGVVTDSDSSHVIDKNKIRREKQNVKAELCSKSDALPLLGLYLDGRKDDTLVIEQAHSKRFRRIIKEEHFSLIQEPGSLYVGHITPNSGSSEDIVKSVISYLSERDISLENLIVIGCDGTSVNTGWKTGLVRRVELYLRKPVQWAICLLHFNELPFRHLFQHLDGNTTGPSTSKGPVGEKLVDCQKLPVVNFQSIDCQIPEIDRNVLSKDQQYLLDISKAIKSGTCEEGLAVRNPGPLSHSRWLTKANRTLRLYISEESPPPELQELVLFILRSYMPLWFTIKTSKHFTDGPKLVYQAIQSTRYLPKPLLDVVDPVIERNGFFAHPEHLLLAMIQDDKKYVRELGLRRILKARQIDARRKTVRTFTPPKINFNAQEYSEMINWMDCELSSPPLLAEISDDEIKSHIDSGSIPDWNITFKQFPVHTQAVERCVKLVTEASGKVCGAESRDGFIKSTLLSRSSMPNFTSKSVFKVPSATK